jgi:hypothetical protein
MVLDESSYRHDVSHGTMNNESSAITATSEVLQVIVSLSRIRLFWLYRLKGHPREGNPAGQLADPRAGKRTRDNRGIGLGKLRVPIAANQPLNRAEKPYQRPASQDP